MDREILFRGKTKYGSWIIGDLLQYANTAQIWTQEEHGKCNYIVDPATVGQFTGLCDKNGVKIFEGDIVFAGYGEYYQGQHEHSATMIIDMADYEALNALCNANVVEVIGNIHDTPDLETKEEAE